MRFTQITFCSLLVAGASASPALIERDCTHNNCLRAIIASNHAPFPSSASKDCSSFMLATVTPATSTSTVTAWATVSSTLVTTTSVETDTVFTTISTLGVNGIARRQQTVIPSAIPTYATACANSAAYSSACSCNGIFATTTTVGAPITVVTVTSTETDTATLTLEAATTTTLGVIATPTFYLQFTSNSGFGGQYLQVDTSSTEASPVGGIPQASKFSINALNNLFTVAGTIDFAYADSGTGSTILWVEDGTSGAGFPITCSISNASPETLACAAESIPNGPPGIATVFQWCPGGEFTGLTIGYKVFNGCSFVEFNVVPV
ncbi:hypothetical protein N431DRAFT_468047 [Stipitochalara longipes BDJ]|nr:hypothetical protein N431DRAFT_468047 [Stipitochalara longipes BDJ]